MVRFGILSRNNMTGDNVILPLEKKNISSHAHKTRSWYLLVVLFKISDEHPVYFLWGVCVGGGGAKVCSEPLARSIFVLVPRSSHRNDLISR